MLGCVQVWFPPGDWQDAWTGATITGPKTMEITPTESEGKYNLPMWHKRGSLLVTIHEGQQRINSQDWSELTIEAFPAVSATETREIFEQEGSAHGNSASTVVELTTDAGKLHVGVSASAVARSWLVRLHLRPGERLALSDESLARMDGIGSVHHIEPLRNCSESGYFPFAGKGSAPGCQAGAIAEFRLEKSNQARLIEATVVISADTK
jgi:hypothetical protein